MKKKIAYQNKTPATPTVLGEALPSSPIAPVEASARMVRTQIYLNRAEFDFVQAEARRRSAPMAAIIRGFIADKMILPDDVWSHNPLLEPTPEDPNFAGPEDASINHDHFVYGCPKSHIKAKGKWAAAPVEMES